MQEELVLYVSERCALCERAVVEVQALSQEFGVPWAVVSIDHTPAPGLPGVPAVRYRRVLYVGVRFARRLRLALLDTSGVARNA